MAKRQLSPLEQEIENLQEEIKKAQNPDNEIAENENIQENDAVDS